MNVRLMERPWDVPAAPVYVTASFPGGRVSCSVRHHGQGRELAREAKRAGSGPIIVGICAPPVYGFVAWWAESPADLLEMVRAMSSS